MITVTVTVHDPVSADVTVAQVLAYVRRVLVAERGWTESKPWRYGAISPSAPPLIAQVTFKPPRAAAAVWFSLPLEECADAGRPIREACEVLATMGIVRVPSEALRAMAAEVVP